MSKVGPARHTGASGESVKAPVTLKSLALRLGVHVSTVSRVLNGDPGKVAGMASAAMAERIRQLARELKYTPNVQAVNLKMRTSRQIAVLVPSVSDVVQALAYEGMVAAARECGYLTYVSNTQDDPAQQLALVRQALNLQVAGLIFTDMHYRMHHPALTLLQDQGVPYVMAYRRRHNELSVSADDVCGGAQVAEHLYANGHRRVGVLAGLPHAATAVERTRGLVAHFRSCGVEIPETAVLHSGIDAHAGHALGRELLSRHPELTAVFAVNDFLAIGLMGACREAGRQIGQDIAIVGYNDISISPYLPVALSSVHVPVEEIGSRAMALLLARIAGRSVSSLVMPPTLNVRQSSDFVLTTVASRRRNT